MSKSTKARIKGIIKAYKAGLIDQCTAYHQITNLYMLKE